MNTNLDNGYFQELVVALNSFKKPKLVPLRWSAVSTPHHTDEKGNHYFVSVHFNGHVTLQKDDMFESPDVVKFNIRLDYDRNVHAFKKIFGQKYGILEYNQLKQAYRTNLYHS